jgi:hypothetical protein
MRELTRKKIAAHVSRRLPGLEANYRKAAAVALVCGLVKDGILIEAPARRRRRKGAAARDTEKVGA